MKSPGILENPESRKLIVVFIALTVFLFAAAVVIGAFSCKRMEDDLSTRESEIIGILIHSSGADGVQVAAAFTSRGNDSDISAGARALAGSGYSGSTADIVYRFARKDATVYGAGVLLAALLAFMLLGVAVYTILFRLYRRVDEASHTVLLAGRGNYHSSMEEAAEGSFARLSHAFNEMSAGVAADFLRLKKERIFLKDLISDISHQLKTPLSALKMYNEIVLQEPVTETVRDFTVKSGTQLERMEWLILGLLKMARLEAGCLTMEMSVCSLKEVAGEAVEDFAAAAREKGVEIAVSGAQAAILCDPGWLKEAVGNVLKNCLEYTPRKGSIFIVTEDSAVMSALSIRDDGPGVCPDDLPFIFRRFYRGRCSSGNGCGIGLSLARSIVEQMGGTLTAGNPPDGGTVFTFSFLKKTI